MKRRPIRKPLTSVVHGYFRSEADCMVITLSLYLLFIAPSARARPGARQAGLLLPRSSEERKLRCKFEPSLLYVDVIGHCLLREVGERGRRRRFVEAEVLPHRVEGLRVLLRGKV